MNTLYNYNVALATFYNLVSNTTNFVDYNILNEYVMMLKDCRNELCLKCERYHEEYLGACNGCRWRD